MLPVGSIFYSHICEQRCDGTSVMQRLKLPAAPKPDLQLLRLLCNLCTHQLHLQSCPSHSTGEYLR